MSKKILKEVRVIGVQFVPRHEEKVVLYPEHYWVDDKLTVQSHRTVDGHTYVLFTVDGELRDKDFPGKWTLEQVQHWTALEEY